jgi:hypothetical protein
MVDQSPPETSEVVLKVRTTAVAPHHDRGSQCPEVVQAPDGVWHACAHESHKVDAAGNPVGEANRKQRLLAVVIPAVIAHRAAGAPPDPVEEEQRSGRAPRKPKVPQDCLCECGVPTRGGRFNPGHDARLRGRLTAAVRDPDLRPADRLSALAKMRELGWGPYVADVAATLEH